MELTRAQKRVMDHLGNGGQLWAVSSAAEPMEDPNLCFVVAVFRDGDFSHTETVQTRTLLELRRQRLIELDI